MSLMKLSMSRLTCDIDIVHVRLRNFVSNLGNQVQNKLDVISFALFGVNIPE